MKVLLCRNRVKNFAKWKKVFDSHTNAHRESGLYLINIWRDLQESNNVFFLFEVKDIDDARTYINKPESEEAGKSSGVIDGEFYFLDDDWSRG